MVTCLNLEEQCSDEIRAKFDLWVVELTAVIAHLENLLGTLNARIEILPGSQGKLDLENLRAEIVIEIDTARRYLAEI